jgi:pilus assembly protein FimV
VLRAAQAQSRPPEAKPLEPLMPDFALDAAAKPAAPAPTPPKPAAPAARDPNLLEFDLDPLPGVGGGLNMDKVASEPPPKMDFKLDLADLDLNAPPQRATAAPAAATAAAKDDHWYDVQQKFDLAKAYEEMGDKDGARDILQEVVREGDAEQKAQAKKLLGPLS